MATTERKKALLMMRRRSEQIAICGRAAARGGELGLWPLPRTALLLLEAERRRDGGQLMVAEKEVSPS